MWFVFPQLTALGTSAMAKRYGIGSVAQAQAYLADPTLGPRLIECCGLLLQAPGDNIGDILEYPDDLKFRSCLSLFLAAAPQEKVFQQCLDRFYAGVPDPRTVSLCRKVDNGQ